MKKSILIPLLVLAVLAVVYLVVTWSEQQSVRPHLKENFVGIDSGAVNKMAIKRLGSLVEFEKRGDHWFVLDRGKAYKAEKGSVDQIEKLAHSMPAGEVVSSNPEKQILFQVDTLTGSTVQYFRDEKLLGSVIIGKVGTDYQHTYVRSPESDDVYNGLGVWAYVFSRPASGFKDKTLLTLDTLAVKTIAFTGRGTDYTLERQDSVWTVLPVSGMPFSPDAAKMSQTLRMMTNLRFSDFLPDPDTLTADFSKADLQVVITMVDGSSTNFSFVAAGGESKNFYVKSSTAEEPYFIMESMVDNVAKKLDDLKPQPSS